MISKFNNSKGGFTLVEIMIVVAIIALLATIAVPSFLRARKRSQATKIVNDARIYAAAIDQWAIEENKTNGQTVDFSDVSDYIKDSSNLVLTSGDDIFGNEYFIDAVSDGVTVNTDSYNALSDVADNEEFWGGYDP